MAIHRLQPPQLPHVCLQLPLAPVSGSHACQLLRAPALYIPDGLLQGEFLTILLSEAIKDDLESRELEDNLESLITLSASTTG
ncbi:hypothetical protein AAFF_G00420180 [Aldrovandia affinis]|uniref:Uncharacterized protein n=1 Tax=Aldrovandia affinis TaxID=143900 RepID=A0AAD7SA39_9TELE|nr:hypothetical protein AAFF_G00420180 [Aldrovandia affinis]